MDIDYSVADEIAAIFREEAAPILAEHFHADSYSLFELVETQDEYGGFSTEESLVESGRCELRAFSANWGGEQMSGPRVVTEGSYELELPLESVATSEHVVYVNGRKFGITNVVRAGEAEMFTTAAVEEVS